MPNFAPAVDRWAPLVLAEQLMKSAVARFEREHQPETFELAAEIFSAMTQGRYKIIRKRLDEAGTLLVETRAGAAREPAQLSTGTREQLYLAIRLAYVRHYCRDAEPLPLVMDDVLVNFDDARAAGNAQRIDRACRRCASRLSHLPQPHGRADSSADCPR